MAKIRQVFFAFILTTFIFSAALTCFDPENVYAAETLSKEDMKGFEKLTFYNSDVPNIIGTLPEGKEISESDTYGFMKRHRLVSTQEGKVTANYAHIGQFHGRDISVDMTFSEFVTKPTDDFGERDGRYMCVPLCFRDNFQYDGDSLVQKMVFYYSDDESKTPIDMTNAFIVINGLNVDEYAGMEEDHKVYLSENSQITEPKTEGRFICYGNGPQGKSDTCITGDDDRKFQLNGTDYEEDIDNPLYYVCSAMFTLNGTENEIYIEDRRKTGGFGIEWSLDLTTLQVTYNITTSVENGTISDPISGIIYNTDQKITYSPSENYILDSVIVDGTPVDISTVPEEYEFRNITQDHDIKVIYKLPYKKIKTEVVNGNITPSDENILFGSNKKISYNPKDGYLLDSISVDRILTDPDKNKDQYLFENIKDDHQIRVVYSKPEAPVKRVLDKNGEFIDGKSVAVGDRLTYEILYKNNMDKKEEIMISDNIPEFTEFESASDGGIYKDGKVVWRITADPLSEGKLSMVVKAVSASKGKTISNYAIESIEGLSLMSNTVKNPVLGDPVKTVCDLNGNDINGQFIERDQELVYSILFTNTASEEKSIQITDIVPEGMEYISADNGGNIQHDTVIWELIVKPGEEKKVSFRAKAQKAGCTYVNQAKVVCDGTNMLTNKVENWTIQPPVKEVKQNGQTIDGGEVTSGDNVDYFISVKNTSSKPADIKIEDKIPEHLEVTQIGNEGKNENGVLCWNLRAVPSQETREVKFTAKVIGDEESLVVSNKATMSIGEKRADSNEAVIKVPAVRKIEVLGEKLIPDIIQKKNTEQGVLGERKIPTGDSSDIMALILIAMCSLAGIIIVRIRND